MSDSRLHERATIVVELTPPGRGAVAVVLVAGPNAVQIVDACFASASGQTIASAPLRRILLGRWGSPSGEDVVICRRAAEEVEIHCHGGAAAVRAVIERLVAENCRVVPWKEHLRESEPDPIRAAARIALADAATDRTCAILLDQHDGALRDAIHAIIAAVKSADWQRAARTVEGLLANCELGQHLTAPWQVVLAGRPNVGKSSLINALAGYQRAIVSHVPGTTRDIVTTATAIDGWPVRLADTAGLRRATDAVESAGVALAEAAIAQADLVVLIDDASEAIDRDAETDTTARTAATVKSTGRLLQVANKIDLLTSDDRMHWRSQWNRPIDDDQMIATSAVTGEGIAALVAAIGRSLVPSAPAKGAAVPFTAAQAAALQDARAAVERRNSDAARFVLQSLLAK